MAMALGFALFVLITASTASQQQDDGYIRFQHQNLFPESFSWDVKHSRFLLGSMTTGSLYTLTDSGKLDLFTADSEYAGRFSVLGIKVDPSRNRVVAVVHSMDSSTAPFNAVAAYDLDTKNRLFLTRLDDTGSRGRTGRAVANDVAVDAEGNLYITNSGQNFIWKITADGKQASVLTDDLLLSSLTVTTDDQLVKPCGLNGIAYHQDNYLLVAQSNTGALFKINLRGEVSLIGGLGDSTLIGADGIVIRQDGAVAVVSSSKAWLVRSSDHWRSASVADDLALNASDFATAVSIRKGMKMYVLYSQLLDLKAGVLRSEFWVRHLEFPKDESDDPLWAIVLLVVMVVLVLGWRFQMGRFFDEYKRKRF